MIGAELSDDCGVGVQWGVPRLESNYEWGLSGREGAGHRRLAGVDQPAGCGTQAGLGEGAHRLEARAEVRRGVRRGPANGGSRLHPDPGFGDDAEGPFTAEQHPVRARPRTRAGQPTRVPRPRRGDGANVFDEVVDVRRTGGEVSGRTGDNPPTHRRSLERLRIEASRQSVVLQLFLELWAGGACAHPRRTGGGIDLDDPAEVLEVEADHAGPVRADVRLDTADDAGAAAVRHDGHVVGGTPVEDRDDVRFGCWPEHGVGRVVDAAYDASHNVAVGSPDTVPGAVETSACRESRKRGRQSRAHAIGRQLLKRRRCDGVADLRAKQPTS